MGALLLASVACGGVAGDSGDPLAALASVACGGVASGTGDALAAFTTGGRSGGLATIGSYKTGILEANGSYFASYRDRNDRMVIMQSLDRGDSWCTLHRTSEGGPQPAALAADEQGRVYAVYTDWNYTGRFLRFDPRDDERVLFRSSFDSETELENWQPFNSSVGDARWTLSGNVPPAGGEHSAKLTYLDGSGIAYGRSLPQEVVDECRSTDCQLRYWVKTQGGDATGDGAYVATFGNTHGGYLQTTPTDWRQRKVSLPPAGTSEQIIVHLETPGMAASFDEIEIVANPSGLYSLAVDRNVGSTNSKFALVYNPVHDVLHWSRRNAAQDMEVVTLSTNGSVVRTRVITTAVDTSSGGHWDSHYQSLAVDPWGSLHLIYNPHYWPKKSDPNDFERVAVLYLRSDDAGDTWRLSDGTAVPTPFATDDFDNGGELISIEANAYVVNLLATDVAVHIVYWTYDPTGSKTSYVRLNRATGDEQQRSTLETSYHSVLIEDSATDLLYLAGEGPDGQPTLYRSSDAGDHWSYFKSFDSAGAQDRSWNYSTGFSKLASSRYVILLSSETDSSGNSDAFFLRYDTSPTAL